MSPEKPILTEKNLLPLIQEERKKIGFLNVDTFKKRKAEYAHQRSLAWYHLIRANVVKAMAHGQAALDIRRMKNPNSECLLADGTRLVIHYESASDRKFRLAAEKESTAERFATVGQKLLREALDKAADAGS